MTKISQGPRSTSHHVLEIYTERDGTETIQGFRKPSGWTAVDDQTTLPIVPHYRQECPRHFVSGRSTSYRTRAKEHLLQSMDPYLRHN